MKKLFFLLLVAITSCLAIAQVPTTGLLDYYPYNGNFRSVNSIAPTFNSPLFVQDRLAKPANALSIGSNQGSVNTQVSFMPQGNADRTVAFFFKPLQSAASLHNIFNYGVGANTFSVYYLNEQIVVTNGTTTMAHPFPFNTGPWKHIAVTHTSGTTKIYIDSVMVMQSVLTFNTNNNICRIGYSPEVTPIGNGGFAFDELAIYDRVLTMQEVGKLYTAERNGWSIFQGRASYISTGSAANVAMVKYPGPDQAYKLNTGTNAWDVIGGAVVNFRQIDIAKDGTIWGRRSVPNPANSNLSRYNSGTNLFSNVTGVLDNIDVRDATYAVGTVGTTGNNIYYSNALNQFTNYTGFTASYVSVGADSSLYAYASNQIYKYNSGSNTWAAVGGTLANVVQISVGDNSKVLVGRSDATLWYLSGNAWVQSTTAPLQVSCVSIASDGTIYITDVRGFIFRTTYLKLTGLTCNLSNNTVTSTFPFCSTQRDTLTALATSTDGVVSYQWQKDGSNLTNSQFFSGVNTSQLIIQHNPNFVLDGTYRVLVTVSCTTVDTSQGIAIYYPRTDVPTDNTPPGNLSVCSGGSTSLFVNNFGNTFWYDAPNGGSILGTGNFYPTNALTANTTFYVQNDSSSFCPLSRLAIPVTIKAAPSAAVSPQTQTICTGSSVTLTASGGGTYAWSNSLGSGAVKSVSPTTATTYTVTVTGANSCTATASSTISVSAIPTAAIAPATVTVCAGANATLTASGGTGYTWSNSGGNNAQATFSPTTNTTYTVTVTNAANCSATASRLVSVNANPVINSVTATADTICAGATTSITASATGTSINYLWSNGHQFPTNPVSPATTTTYTVTVTSVPSNCTATASKTITVNAVPNAAIAAADSICPGVSTTLTASGGGTYTWSNSLGAGAVKTVSPTANTTYTVTVTGANGCTATATKNVRTHAPVSSAITQDPNNTTCPGIPVLLSVNATNPTGSVYLWSTGATGTTANSITVTPPATTTYWAKVTSPKGCVDSTSKTVSIISISAGITGATSVCPGGSVTLTATGGGTYVWSNSGGNNAQASFTPTQATTYTVTVSNNGCSATASQTVTLQSAPTATITGVTSVCAGGSVTLTANGGSTYTWSNNGGNNAQATFTPTANTTYTVTVSAGANCSATATQTVTIKQPSSSTQNQTICTGKTLSFNGQTLSQSGAYRDTILNAAGCDSVITLNLTVTPALQGSFAQTICTGKTFTFNGKTLSQSGAYKDTVQTSGGCDSIITLNLTVTPALQSSLSETVCNGDSYTFNGQTLTQSGVFKDTVQTSGGCDSIITLNLTVLNKIENIINAGICTGQSYTFKGQTLTQDGQYFDTLQTALGCDSFITLNLTVNSFVTSTVNAEICQGLSYTFNGKTLTQDGQYNDTLTSVGGCDSIVTLTLTVNALPQPNITQNGNVLSTQTFDNYQWQLGGGDINSATAQSHTAVANGNYTVLVIDSNGCSAFSPVYNVTGVGVEDLQFTDLRFTIYPNPTESILNIEVVDIRTKNQESRFEIVDMQGRVVMTSTFEEKTTLDVSELAATTYQVRISNGNSTSVKRFVKL